MGRKKRKSDELKMEAPVVKKISVDQEVPSDERYHDKNYLGIVEMNLTKLLPKEISLEVLSFLDTRLKCMDCGEIEDDHDKYPDKIVYVNECAFCDRVSCEGCGCERELTHPCQIESCYHCSKGTCFNNRSSYVCRECKSNVEESSNCTSEEE
jgi:hypothetical protein